MDSLSRALERAPELGVAHEARGSARLGLGQLREAARDYQRAAELDPDRASPLWGLAECYRQLGDRRAVEVYQRYASHGGADATPRLRELASQRAEELRNR